MEIYSVNRRIQSEYREIWTRLNSYLGTFHAVPFSLTCITDYDAERQNIMQSNNSRQLKLNTFKTQVAKNMGEKDIQLSTVFCWRYCYSYFKYLVIRVLSFFMQSTDTMQTQQSFTVELQH